MSHGNHGNNYLNISKSLEMLNDKTSKDLDLPQTGATSKCSLILAISINEKWPNIFLDI